MDRYKNKGLENNPDQPNEGSRLSTDHFHSGARRLYLYSRNLDDKKCALPPVPGDDRARKAIVTDNADDGHFTGIRQGTCRTHQYSAWDQDPSHALRLEDAAPPADWKEERKRRVKNAMRRVEQSYVGELRYCSNETTYVRPDCSELPAETRKPYALVPINAEGVATPSWALGDTKVVAKEPRAENNDRSLLIPSSNGKNAYRSPDEEYELDLKRQALLEKKIREANEFHRKQKLNAFKPCKNDAKEKTRGHVNTHNVPNPPSMQNRQTASHRYTETEVTVPVPPMHERKEESYSKRKRKLKPCSTMSSIENSIAQYPSMPSEEKDAQRADFFVGVGTATRLSQVVPSTTREGKHGVSFEVNTKGFECVSNRVRASDTDTRAEGKPSGPKPPLIPRQASFNIWNGDTAKRGLGFKSKLRKEMEAASLRAVEPKEDAHPQRTQRPYVSSEVAAKWKREMFYNN